MCVGAGEWMGGGQARVSAPGTASGSQLRAFHHRINHCRMAVATLRRRCAGAGSHGACVKPSSMLCLARPLGARKCVAHAGTARCTTPKPPTI